MSKATITVEGFVTKDPELKQHNGKPVIAVDIAHTPRKKDGNQWVDAGDTIWFQAAFWEQDAEAIANIVRKGTLVTVTGYPELNVYQRQDSTAGVTVRIKGGTLGVIPRQAQGGQQRPSDPYAGQTDYTQQNGPQTGAQDAWATTSIPDDETPF